MKLATQTDRHGRVYTAKADLCLQNNHPEHNQPKHNAVVTVEMSEREVVVTLLDDEGGHSLGRIVIEAYETALRYQVQDKDGSSVADAEGDVATLPFADLHTFMAQCGFGLTEAGFQADDMRGAEYGSWIVLVVNDGYRIRRFNGRKRKAAWEMTIAKQEEFQEWAKETVGPVQI